MRKAQNLDYLTDEELVKLSCAGEREAFAILIRRYQDRIYSLVYRYVGNPEDALDLTQETFIKVFTKLGEFKGKSKFYTWLYRIAVNVCIDFRRRQHISAVYWDDIKPVELNPFEVDESSEHYDVPDENGDPERRAIDSELRLRIREAVDALPEQLRVVLLLREYEDMSYEEIAKIIGCPVGTIKSRLFQAREMLKRMLAPYMRI
ncbi:MAG: sigma-70 family RNA polymerase sigma factor [Armatimonadota bacterium]|nr:sigma-70 family RNA polymerase sigma factor [Armatimonadota bacterium]MCX7776893.1 sigma-70 family RNA polymerase sigma factor [Armatimonadota bacterium]MDW8024421.1 sigma-70 family RNA polymerase sigma factor [Armatimonadota bacterium]